MLYSPALPVKVFAASLGALRAVVGVLMHDILFINRGRDKHWSDDIWMTFFVGTIDMSPTPSILDFAASLGALRAVVNRAEARHKQSCQPRGAWARALIDGMMRLFGTASKSLPLRWGLACASLGELVANEFV